MTLTPQTFPPFSYAGISMMHAQIIVTPILPGSEDFSIIHLPSEINIFLNNRYPDNGAPPRVGGATLFQLCTCIHSWEGGVQGGCRGGGQGSHARANPHGVSAPEPSGPARIPKVAATVTNYFGPVPVRNTIAPEEAVACGAATQAFARGPSRRPRPKDGGLESTSLARDIASTDGGIHFPRSYI